MHDGPSTGVPHGCSYSEESQAALYNHNKGAGPAYSNAAYHLACLAEEGEVSSGPPAQPKAGATSGVAPKGPNHWQSAKVAARAAAAEAAKTPLERAREEAERATAAAAAAVAKAEALERETADRCGGGVG